VNTILQLLKTEMEERSSAHKRKACALPLTRVKTIMRSSPDVSSISPEAIALMAHSAKLFISQLVGDSLDESHSRDQLEYKDLAHVVATHKRMAFLQDILPQKMTVRDFDRLVTEYEKQHKSVGRDHKH